MSKQIFDVPVSRRRFLQATGVAGAAGAAGIGTGAIPGFTSLSKANAQGTAKAGGPTVITKSFCHQCPARCGIDVYTTDARVHAIYGTLDNPLSNGKLCPKGHYGQYLLYDPDRFKSPMKRTNPKKGRNEDPKFVPISWDEALGIAAKRLNDLRDKNESHRFGVLFGRGWGATDAGLFGNFAKLYGSPNVGLNHSSMCADASKKAKLCVDGNYSYNSYDYENTNYLLIFGANYLDAFRPLNANMQAWGKMRTKSPKTRVTVVDVHLSTTGSAADRLLLVKSGTDGALALGIAHVIMAEGLWDRLFVGDFLPPVQPKDPAAPRIPAPRFEAGKEIEAKLFAQKWVHGLPEWWNAVLKDCTPEWAEKITTISAKDIRTVARELATTKPAMVLFERGATAHTNGTYNGMAIHSLNALIGSMFAEGGLGYQSSTPWAKLPLQADEFMDDYAKSGERKKPRIDLVKTDKWPMASNMMQEIAQNHNAAKPYKMDTVMFYLTGPVFSGPECVAWEKMLAETFVIDTSPAICETAVFADLVLPDHTYLERLQIGDSYPFQGYPMAMIRTPAVKPIHDTKVFGDVVIEIGKRIKGPMGEYYKQLDNTENIIKQMAKGFEEKPGSNGVNSYESFKEKGVWYKKPYSYRQIRGEFFTWNSDSKSYANPMKPEDVKEKLFKTKTGKFEVKSGYLEDDHYARWVSEKTGVPEANVGFPQYIPAKHPGGGDLHFISPKLALQAEGRSTNLPHATAIMQPLQGGRQTVYLEIHPDTAAKRGIKNGDRVRIRSSVGAIECNARIFGGIRPDVVSLPMIHGHWGSGRWSKDRGVSASTNEVTPNVSEPISGLACYHSAKVFVEKV